MARKASGLAIIGVPRAFPPAAPLVVHQRPRAPHDAGFPSAPDPEQADRLRERQVAALLAMGLPAEPEEVRIRDATPAELAGMRQR